MDVLHLFRHAPDPVTRELAGIVSRDRETTAYHLYEAPVDYHRLLDLILTHRQVISWW